MRRVVIFRVPSSIHPALIRTSASADFPPARSRPAVIFRDVVAHGSALVFGRAEQDIDRLEIAHRGLRIDVELAERFDFVAEKFHAHRELRLPGKEVEDSAADGELSAGCDLRDAFVTGFV